MSMDSHDGMILIGKNRTEQALFPQQKFLHDTDDMLYSTECYDYELQKNTDHMNTFNFFMSSGCRYLHGLKISWWALVTVTIHTGTCNSFSSSHIAPNYTFLNSRNKTSKSHASDADPWTLWSHFITQHVVVGQSAVFLCIWEGI
jgi:hypothetical protein